MDEQIKEQIRFVLQDDNELLRAALGKDSDLDAESRRMNRQLIDRHEQILAKLDRGEQLSQEDFQLIRDANRIHVTDADNLNGHHGVAIVLEDWLDQRMELSQGQAMEILEQWLDRDCATPARVYRALHALWEEATPNEGVQEVGFDQEGRCLRCGSRVSFADVTDTVVFVGDEIVKRYDGGITNRNCVRCAYPEQYADYGEYDQGKCAADGSLRRRGGEAPPSPSYSNTCKEVDEKMKFDMQSKLDEYLRLLEQIRQKTTDERTAVALLQEVSKDRRSAEMREDRETKNGEGKKNSQPATEKQKEFMDKLGIEYPADVTKQYASMLIDERRGKNGE